MTVRVASPVLLPFGKDINIIKELSEKKIYICPQYKFWGKNLEILINNTPTQYTISYMKEKINDDFSGIVKPSQYFNFLTKTFNPSTAIFLDKLYQIELDKNHKDILVLLLTKEFEKYMDDVNKCKKIHFGIEELNYILDHPKSYFNIPKIKRMDINFIKQDIGNSKFATIYDSIPRESRMYDVYYLGFVSLFSGVKETLTSWRDVLIKTADENLIHDGFLILRSFPREYETKIKHILAKKKFTKIYKENVWRKPDLTVKKISKGIKRYF